MEDTGIHILWPFGQFSGHLVYFRTLWCILCSFGVLSPFWYIVQRKIWQPWFDPPFNQERGGRGLEFDSKCCMFM
jgi:hypothetical protein